MKLTLFSSLSLLFLLTCTCSLQAAEVFNLPKSNDNLIGSLYTAKVNRGDTLSWLAQMHGMGYLEMRNANPDVNPRRLKVKSNILIPSAYILPPGGYHGIVINLSELRLYYFSPGDGTVITAPIAIGRQGWETPMEDTEVIGKATDPAWHVPESIRRHSAAKGKPLPEIMQAGPDNPLGDHVLRLGLKSILIHGTNDNSTIGKRISSGCIRMYPNDIAMLYSDVPVGTSVRIINMPYKVGWYHGELYLEAHKPITSSKNLAPDLDYKNIILAQVGEHHSDRIDWEAVKKVINQQNGYPQPISYNAKPLPKEPDSPGEDFISIY